MMQETIEKPHSVSHLRARGEARTKVNRNHISTVINF